MSCVHGKSDRGNASEITSYATIERTDFSNAFVLDNLV